MLDLTKIPFSMRGSYIAVSVFPENTNHQSNKPGIYLRTVHGLAYIPNSTMNVVPPFAARLVPTYRQKEIAFETEASETEIRLITKHGDIGICFADSDTLLVTGTGAGLGVKLCLVEGNYAYAVGDGSSEGILLNCAVNGRRFYVRQTHGFVSTEKEDDATFCNVVSAEADKNGRLLFGIEDVADEWSREKRSYDYAQSRREREEEFSAYLALTPSVPEEYAEARRLAAYINWSCLVKKEGLLTREAMLMAKNWMCNVWSWDHCFNAIALSYHYPELAWEQLMLLFDYQSESGRIPDCVSDTYAIWNFVKPPVHGWALLYMMRHMTLTEAQCREAYDKLSKWTEWWLTYRDTDGDGICEYHHGNDAGWDNATVFTACPSMELPDLSAFLILQMKALSVLAERLGRSEEAAMWQSRKEAMRKAMLVHSFSDGHPIAVATGSHCQTESDSLILYLPLLLGEELPEEIRNHMIQTLKSDRFLTPHGLATEAVDSCYYEADGYWRGPIWAPSTLLFVDGLARCGEAAFAKELAKRFCDMVKQSGCAENYDALTGEGLRDKAYTWTSSVFLILAHDYC